MDTTRTAVTLFDEYVRDHRAALEPCICCLLEKCPPSELPALNALLDHHLETDYARPPYSPVQQRRLMEKIEPIVDRAMRDPAVMADQDQRDARWRDTPWIVKRWRRTRFFVRWTLRLRLQWMLWHRWQKQPWE